MLKDKTFAFLGAGMMAEAIIRGLLNAGVGPGQIRISDPNENRVRSLVDELGVTSASDNESGARSADIVVLAVKPHIAPTVLEEVGDVVNPGQLLVSIVTGVTTAAMEGKLQEGVPVVRVVPNTPCLIGEGASAVAPGKNARQEHLDLAVGIFQAVGMVVRVDEYQLNAVTGLIGSGPAYVYTFIEALADGGVRMGLPKQTALALAAQTVKGAAMMVMNTGVHPAELKDRVMTPGGTTIAALASLEKAGFRSAIIEAVTIATNRAEELGKSE